MRVKVSRIESFRSTRAIPFMHHHADFVQTLFGYAPPEALLSRRSGIFIRIERIEGCEVRP